ncbi:hypothetical protein RHGRI_037189 [Rhododendron griersonianum]|uniref:Uncharacterized protein n=1 Tax=Rhododendron griersonianum TaxID=479676 RepID=A0AAV6HRW4_9ERIC|nr:hypothetical protein RHGRI_037189 [Rhododendron griersonianum]
MENPSTDNPWSRMPHTLAPSTSRRRTSTDPANSPEFEFWKVLNPSLPQPDLLSADELFVNGVLLPLHLLHLHPNHDPPDNPQPATENPDPEPKPISDPGPGPELSSLLPDPAAAALGVSKRWIDMFKKSDRKDESCKEKEKKKERKGTGVSGAELNIYLWPFSRSRSAGNGGNRPRTAAAARKVSSAPCSRSNSAGESKTRRSSPSPSRVGVHLGRSSPVWKVRRGGVGGGRSFDPVAVVRSQKDGNETGRKRTSADGGGGGSKARALNLNVPMCIGYRQHLSCRSDGSGAVKVAAGGGGGGSGHGGDGGRGGNLFNLRSFFTKKVY